MSLPDQPVASGWSQTTTHALRWGPAALLVVAIAATFIAYIATGGAEPLVVGDTGPIVRWGVPLGRLAFNLTASLTIGALVMAVWAASRTQPEFERCLVIAQGASVAWTLSSIYATIVTYLDVSTIPFSADAEFGQGLWYYLTNLEMGQMWLMATVMIAMLTTFIFASRSAWRVLLTTIFALLCLWPIATLGHAAGASSHETAVGANTLHYTAAAVWIGGVLVLAMVTPRIKPKRRLALTERFSDLALLAFVATAFSGVVASFLNLSALSDLWTTGYGGIVLTKTVLLVILGGFGVAQRRFFIDRMRAQFQDGFDAKAAGPLSRQPLAWLIAAELLVMGAVSGAAAALGRSPRPQPQITADQLPDPTPAQLLSGDALPPEFTASRLLTEWRLDPLWTLLVLMGMAFYILGTARLRRRGDRWPWWRVASFLTGCVILLYNVNGALVVYGKFMFSFHMTEHMILSMIIPIFLVLGAPMTLLLRAIPARTDGSMGAREWALKIVHSKWAAFVSHPIVAAINFALALLTFYYTPLFRWSVADHVGHMWMIAHFLIVGFLFVESLIGDDPMRTRASYPMRLIALILVMTFHAFFGLGVMTGEALLVAEWFGATGRDWGPATAIADQQLGGAVAWGLGEFPTVILALLVGLQWAKSDERAAKREDRNAERTHDAELNAYNEHLRMLAERDANR